MTLPFAISLLRRNAAAGIALSPARQAVMADMIALASGERVYWLVMWGPRVFCRVEGAKW
jgi:hypothetical protein